MFFVTVVLNWCSPAKIVVAVVSGIIVKVHGLAAKRTGTGKGFEYQGVNVLLPSFAVLDYRYKAVSPRQLGYFQESQLSTRKNPLPVGENGKNASVSASPVIFRTGDLSTFRQCGNIEKSHSKTLLARVELWEEGRRGHYSSSVFAF